MVHLPMTLRCPTVLFLALSLSSRTLAYDGTLLAGGSFQTRTNVDSQADLALDVRDMYTALSSDDFNTARNIYISGKNSVQLDSNGQELPYKRSLSSLSLDAEKGLYDGEITFSFQLYGLSGQDSEKVPLFQTYADEYVQNVLADSTTGTLAAEAVTVLHVWMRTAHEIWSSVSECQGVMDSHAADVATSFQTTIDQGARSFDEIMAYWVGADQEAGNASGHSMYALAQKTAELFGTDVNGMEAMVNRDLRYLFEDGQSVLSMQDACMPGTDHLGRLWSIGTRMISAMTIPLVQMLIHHMKNENTNMIKMYAMAVVPQVSVLKITTYRYLKQQLLDRPYNPANFNKVLTELQSVYEFLGFDCERVGAYQDGQVGQCADRPTNLPMAGYSPTTNVFPMAKIDLDIVQISVLSDLNAFQTANYLYTFGKNAIMEDDSNLSLKQMATTRDREAVTPFFKEFEEYYNNKFYADTVIQQTLDGEGKWGKAPTPQRSVMISNTLKYQVMYMYLLSEMEDAVKDCRKGDFTDNNFSVHSWDEVAAYMIGSLEGIHDGGGDVSDGQLLWNLANKRCAQFGTCNSQGYSVINAELENLLYAGKGELTAFDCNNLFHTTHKIQHIILIPIIQSVLRYAIKNQKLPPNSQSRDIAIGESYAMAILPIVQYYAPASAETIRLNMVSQQNVKPVIDGAQTTGDAFYDIMDEFGLQCKYVGISEGVDTCIMFNSSALDAKLGAWRWSFITGAVGLFTLFWSV